MCRPSALPRHQKPATPRATGIARAGSGVRGAVHPGERPHRCQQVFLNQATPSSRVHPARGPRKTSPAPANPRKAASENPCSARESPTSSGQARKAVSGFASRRSPVRSRHAASVGSCPLQVFCALRSQPDNTGARAVRADRVDSGPLDSSPVSQSRVRSSNGAGLACRELAGSGPVASRLRSCGRESAAHRGAPRKAAL